MNHCLFKAKDTKGAVGNTVDYSSLTNIWFRGRKNFQLRCIKIHREKSKKQQCRRMYKQLIHAAAPLFYQDHALP